ncbi:hypothetical protein PR048_001363 [Dryococelus australis]|uniref:Uncharacterized protein n=1 Tax=Dryococelus australis TaxID=614101 RepID=A0ABQ9IH92_9NEOP|nr:hypothetical protein PR048_001363 [Dryococelus australis]
MCSMCLQLRERISSAKDEIEKGTSNTELRVHKARAKNFFEVLRDEDPSKLIVSFDCEKNIPVPRLPDQCVYYSKLFYVFNFTVVRGRSDTNISPENVTSFMWTENELPKDANSIALCVFDFLQSTDMSDYTTLGVVSNGCGGQNKNTVMVAMILKWFVTGHSYIPPDKAFGFIERDIKKREIIRTREEVYDQVSKHSTVKKVGKDTKVYDYKGSLKGSKPNNILVCGEPHNKTDIDTYRNLFMTKCSYNDIQHTKMTTRNKVTTEKEKEVENLLQKHYGEKWRSFEALKFYAHVIDGSEDSASTETQCCQSQAEEQNVFI